VNKASLLVAPMLGACLMASCNSNAQQESSMDLDPATAAYQKHGYNTLPVEARLGPHRFMIPAHYFRDQIGPDFQGNFSLLVQWPDLEPLPPGKRSAQDMETFNEQITIAPRYVDRVPIEGVLERLAAPTAEAGWVEADDPRERLDLMLAQPERDGLTPYKVDRAKLDAYADRYRSEVGVSTATTPETYKDWFVRRGPDGALLTLIRCDPESPPDRNERPLCTHHLIMSELNTSISIDYAREYLRAWRRIEDRVRALLSDYRSM
jgi:hypothetical protein